MAIHGFGGQTNKCGTCKEFINSKNRASDGSRYCKIAKQYRAADQPEMYKNGDRGFFSHNCHYYITTAVYETLIAVKLDEVECLEHERRILVELQEKYLKEYDNGEFWEMYNVVGPAISDVIRSSDEEDKVLLCEQIRDQFFVGIIEEVEQYSSSGRAIPEEFIQAFRDTYMNMVRRLYDAFVLKKDTPVTPTEGTVHCLSPLSSQ